MKRRHRRLQPPKEIPTREELQETLEALRGMAEIDEGPRRKLVGMLEGLDAIYGELQREDSSLARLRGIARVLRQREGGSTGSGEKDP